MTNSLARRVQDVLARLYPEPATQLRFSNPWELLVATILSAQCTDARVNLVTPVLFARWPGPQELASASIEELEEVIRSTGFYHNKARHLKECAARVRDAFAGELPRTMPELLTLSGVARKTANVVLFAGFGLNEGIAVDTHVRRISYRIGLTDNLEPPKIERDLMDLFPRKEWGNLNHRLVQFGRDVCVARKPQCQNCPLNSLCARRPLPEGKRSSAD